MSVQLVRKWGNSPAIRLPAAIMEAARLALDQRVEIRAENGRVIIEPVAPTHALEELLAGITPQNINGELDFGGPVGKEML